MAKNDYFVIAYRILAYLYACMKNGEKVNVNIISYEELNINYRYWLDVIIMLYDEEYIKGITINKVLGNEYNARIDNIKITQKGIQFLQENSSMAKAKEFLKTLKEIIPGL